MNNNNIDENIQIKTRDVLFWAKPSRFILMRKTLTRLSIMSGITSKKYKKMRFVIEKELCDPPKGPYYHVVQADDETGNREVLETFDGHIEDAARFAERELDFQELEVSYMRDPDLFSSAPRPNLE